MSSLAAEFEHREYRSENVKGTLNYRFFIPKGYKADKRYPLIVFLHGAGERGSDNECHLIAYKGATIWAEPENQKIQPCFIFAPQCPEEGQWVNVPFDQGDYDQDVTPISIQLRMVMETIEELKNNYNIDERKICITGISMGGYGTWDAIIRYPGVFAAAAPVCGCGPVNKAKLAKGTPIWAFHGTEDKAVPYLDDEQMIAAIKKEGGNPEFTVYQGADHFIWNAAYSKQLVEWMFQQIGAS